MHMKKDIKSKEWDKSNREENQDSSKFDFCSNGNNDKNNDHNNINDF